MKLTVVGCAGSFPGPRSPASCYLIEHDGTRLLLDMGNGSLGALANYIDIYDIDAIAFSHLHIDHCVDACSYYVARKYRPGASMRRISVFGPAGVGDRLAQMYGLDAVPGMREQFDFIEYGSLPITVGPMTVTAYPVQHCVPAFAIKVEAAGRSIVYSGDTGPCDGLVEASRGADVGLYEASYLERNENEPRMHMTGRDAAATAIAADVSRLVLTHLVAWYDEAEALADATQLYDGDVRLAAPGMVMEI